jgi:ankyrin repeat protein
LCAVGAETWAQTPPSTAEIAAYTGLHAAAASGDTGAIDRLVKSGADLNARDGNGRTPLMVAVFRRDDAAAKALIDAGANLNALDHQSYDVITMAAVANDLDTLRLAIAAGGNTRAITSPYGGTALIAAAHLGHVEVVEMLIAARAPLDHVNNLGWTALIEAIVLGDGGERHQATLAALIKAGADVNLPDKNGVTPLSLARGRGYGAMVDLLEKTGAKP